MMNSSATVPNKAVSGTGFWDRRAMALLVLATGAFVNMSPVLAADDNPELKADTPRLDKTVPKSNVLKGGVLHTESGADKGKLQGAAMGTEKSNGLKGGIGDKLGKLFSSKAKLDKVKPLQTQARNDVLNSAVQSGVGIIGVKFVLTYGRPPVINRVFPGTPSWTVGLRNGDIIIAVDGVPTLGMTKEEVYEMIVGSPGTPVTVTVSRNGDYLPRTMTRMDFNDITDPNVRRDYIMSM